MTQRVTQTFRSPQTSGSVARRVLLVDDEIAVAKAFARLLTAAGFEVELRSDGEGAVEALTQSAFDVVISDIRLPTISGVELLEMIRAYDLDIPVILMTGLPSVETAIAAIELGALQYLTKPVDKDVLLKAVRRAANLHAMARAKRDALDLLGQGALPGDRAGLAASFDRALDSLWPAFQPIVDAKGTLVAYEALLRSREPSLPHPGAVLSAAETLERTSDVGERMRAVTAEAFSTAPPGALLFVNLHPLDLLDPRLTDPNAPLSALAERVVLEITERATLDEIKDVQARIRRLRDLGFRIAIDDLGAGYAGLTSFAMLEPDIVKLDMTLVRNVDSSDVKQRIVGSMATLSKEMGMRVVAEGIEMPGERRAVTLLGCEWLQGYLFAKPGPAFPEVSGG